jgi:FAD/FMN-containing dehydrogenase
MKGIGRRGYFYVAFATTLNIVLYALTGGRYLHLEGRVRGGLFRNWCRRFAYRPAGFALPATEAELVTLVKNSAGVRVYGAGHSFNDGIVADHILVSLDRLSGMLWRDLTTMEAAFKGGTRVRDISRMLYDSGAAIGALPSHDAQSIAGIISTDVHGTGRDWGFVSRWVERIRLIDASGEIHILEPSDELFKAAIGGIGAAGIISEVVLRAVPRFNVEQRVRMSKLTEVRNDFDRLFQQNRHLSLYLFPFTDRCQVNTWNPTERPRSFLGPLREFLSISKDALLSAWLGGLMADMGLLPRLSTLAHGFKRGTSLVLESYKAFNRTIYHLHEELEFTVPSERAFEVCDRLIKLYERMYRESRLPYTLFEVRFTPAGHDRTLVGAGRERRSAWINICCNDSGRFEAYYAAAEALIKEEGGLARPHLGKYCFGLGREEMRRAHPETFPQFLRLVHEHDPAGKFSNDLTRRMFRD